MQYPEDTSATRTNYTYDSMYRLANAAVTTDTGTTLSASYTYTDDLLTAIQTGSTPYSFSYGDFGLRTGISIEDRILATYSYTDDRNNYLASLDYGNGGSVDYTYDSQGRVTKETFEDGATVTYQYDNSGALATVTDSQSGIKTTYYYDFTDRLMKYVESGSGYSHSVGYEYDDINNLTKLVETINGTTYTTTYTYDDDNRLTAIINGTVSDHYTYDAYGRVSQQQTKNGSSVVLTDSYTFKNPTSTTTSAQIATHTVTSAGYSESYSYTYDDNGNILSVNNGIYTISYAYDSANQLIREDNPVAEKTWTWTYDNAGNILNRKEYAYTTGTLGTPTDTFEYSYNYDDGRDMLTGYDDFYFSIDVIGNIGYDEMWYYAWHHGRQLDYMYDDASNFWNYTYNADGLRTKRTGTNKTYSYVYNGSSLSQMTVTTTNADGTVTTDLLEFTYDANGRPTTLTHNGTLYYYVTNLQGDVAAILDASGDLAAYYVYSAWGEMVDIQGATIGNLNPLRYRGYVYDQETELYYLQSRYYNPKWGRFISADAYISTGQGILGNNMFAYCGNNPVRFKDDSGTRYCAATTVDGESAADRSVACAYQNKITGKQTVISTLIANIEEISAAFYNNVEVSAGVGLGLMAEANVCDFAGLGLGLNYNLVELKLDDGALSVEQSYSMGLEASVLFIDVLQDASDSGSRKLTFSSPLGNFIPDDYNRNWTILSAGGYIIAGGSVYIGFDMISFCEEIHTKYFYD